jgi:hypothetical protein
MTFEEALCWCNQFEDNIILVNPQSPKKTLALQAMKQCKEALEKQIPKRINEYNRCPCCDTYNETIEKRKNTVKSDICYCWHCGQAIDWSDTE